MVGMKLKKISAVLIALIMTAIPAFSVYGEEQVQSETYVESVSINLPDIYLYVSGIEDGSSVDAKATLDGEALTYSGSEAYDPSSVSTCIYVLADISGSVSSEMYKAVSSVIKSFMSELTDNQTLKFYTFSQETQCILDGTEEYSDACTKLDGVQVTGNGYTALYDALYLIHETAASEKSLYDRQLVFIFTDGNNEDNKAKRTADETKALYKVLDLPIYAMCMSSASSSSKQILGEIARLSGGTNVIYSTSDIETKFSELKNTAYSCVRLHFTKKNNKAADTDKNLSVSINGTELPAVTVYESAVSIQEDDTAPEYTVSYSSENRCLVVQYSEAVVNADSVSSYIIINSDGESVTADSVQYDESAYTAYLYFSGRFYSDTYTIRLSGVTDDSFAANAPLNDVTVSIQADSAALKLLDYWWIIILLLCIVILVLFVILMAKRKRKVTNVRELFEVENENNYEVKHHIVNAPSGTPVFLNISTGNMHNQIKTHIISSIIFGRSDVCDICIDDVKLSRQHFAVEMAENGELFLMDLHSTNGTYLNSVKVVSKVKLKAGDEISAGLTKIQIQF